MFDDATCSGDLPNCCFVVHQCWEDNYKAYSLQCTDDSITRTQFENIQDCYNDNTGNTTDITPRNTSHYCYTFKCGTHSFKFDHGNNGRRYSQNIAFILISIIIMFILS